jgi:4-amino-4-deoxy-L-arabinose transferase-like glycosyltransferase
MDVSRLSRSELIAAFGGILLLVGIFLPWYVPNTENRNAIVAGSREAVSAWDAHSLLRFLLLAAAMAPLILAYIVIRDHELSWPRGEMTAVVAMAALGLVLYSGVVTRPGEPRAQISLQLGWFLAVVGIVLMLVGGATRAAEVERARKPPGVL